MYTAAGGVAEITINRPEKRNALNAEARSGLFAAFRRAEEDERCRVIILTGAGDKAFCAGMDLKEMSELGLRTLPPDFFPVPGKNIELSKPTIAAVNGIATAGGFWLAQQCDLCVAAEHATFGIAEAKWGRGAPWSVPLAAMLPRRVMLEMLLTGEPLTAQRMYALGFVNDVAPARNVLERAREIATRIAANAPLTVAGHRRIAYLTDELTVRQAEERADEIFEPIYASADAQEGPRAFSEGRRPTWSGV
ncbi:enoyl-CoA hydratase/isomerase family protein [Dactylosporangium roseum]|uniref:Enoyl-CoA hydratase/isomerase family protein n=1 Tax=Dactylosporangium roseum TaxID=47989 RepID=A0ABY5YXK5_9ACTN|nr:enoyl-CoA hydratase-related protein [Dactylosporangium roseum]UWZ34481.1 enoyl-CoA hydratase/isomerase family protein [Dactylosporangium roseum]